MSHDPVNPSIMELGILKYLIQEGPAHLVISTPHIRLDRHQVLTRGGTLQVMHELLDEQDIISDAMVTDENTLFRTIQAGNDGLHMPDEDPSIYFIECGAKPD